MKKLLSAILVSLITLGSVFPTVANARVTEESLGYKILAESQNQSELITVKDFSVIDGDTADFILDRAKEPSIKARFLLIDAPELENKPYAKEAKNRVRELFKSADLIQIEYEGPTKDKYERDLVHVWVDGILLQEILVTEGLAIACYIEDYLPNSKYVQTIYDSQDYAAKSGFKLWGSGDTEFLANAEGLSTAYSVSEQGAGATETSGIVSPVGLVGNNNSTTYEEPATYVEPAVENVYYQNCDAVRAAGKAPIYPGDPGFQSKFDRDNDGIGCE